MTQLERPTAAGTPQRAEPERPALRAIGKIAARQRVAVAGVITGGAAMSISGCPACRYTLADDTGEIDLLFLGRVAVAGFEPGRHCTAEGAAAERDGQLVIWNPRYQLLPADTDG